MKLRYWTAVLAAALLLAGCSKPKEYEKKALLREQLIGKWTTEGGWIDFTPGGLVGRMDRGSGWAASYNLVDGSRIEVTEPGKEGEAVVWNAEVSGDTLKLVLNGGTTEEYTREAKTGEAPDAKLVGLWGSTSVGQGRENLMEFTDQGTFVSFRWISSAETGDKYKVGETGTYKAIGGKLTLNGARKREFTKELEYKIDGSVLEVLGMWKDKDGNPTSRSYHRR
ncbi:MAG: hypothetical protein KC910_10895 [Candidatus Eremiobacteraeota bacterium]|nr:hypothetical protein [Candidatus Eremiobacteraeota bacterium]